MENSLSDRISHFLEQKNIPYEIKRFGGFNYFMTAGKVIAAAVNSDMLVKCKPSGLDEILKRPEIKPIPDAAGIPQKDMFLVQSTAIDSDDELASFLAIGLDYATQ